MRYVSAYMLAAMGSKHHVTVNDIENILGSVGVDCEHDKAVEVVKKMQGKTLDELITEGSRYLTSGPAASSCIGVFLYNYLCKKLTFWVTYFLVQIIIIFPWSSGKEI